INVATFSQVASVDIGDEPYGVRAAPDGGSVLVTNRLQDSKGYNVVTVSGNSLSVSHSLQLTLGSFLDAHDFNNAQGVVVTKDASLGFILGFNRYIQGVASRDPNSSSTMPAGGNVGIITDPLGLNGAPRLVAATRMIPFSFPSELALSNDDKFLYASYRASGAVFVFDVEKIRTALDTLSPEKMAMLATKPIDHPDLVPAIDARANFHLTQGSDPPRFAYDPAKPGGPPIGTGGLPGGSDVQPPGQPPIALITGLDDRLFVDDDGTFAFTVKNDGSPGAGRLRAKVVVTGNSGTQRFLDLPAGSRFRNAGPFTLNPQQARTFQVNVRDLIPRIKTANSEINIDRLYGAKVEVFTYPVGSPIPANPSTTAFIYRFLDVADPDHDDGIIEFSDVVDDGAGGALRDREIKYFMPNSVIGDIAIDDTTHFRTTQNAAGNDDAFRFDPEVAQDDLATDVNFETPNGDIAGTMQLLGDGRNKTKINFNKNQLKEVLRKIAAGSTPQDVVVTRINPVNNGTFTITLLGDTTAAINIDDSAATVQAELEALAGIAPGDVLVTKKEVGIGEIQIGGVPTPADQAIYTIHFEGNLDSTNVPTGAAAGAGLGFVNIQVTPHVPSTEVPAAEKQLFDTDAERTNIVNMIEAAGIQLFTDVSDGVELGTAPGPDTISIHWDTTPEPGYGGTSGPPAPLSGPGVDDYDDHTDVVNNRNNFNTAVNNFKLAEVTNKVTMSDVLVFLDTMLEENIDINAVNPDGNASLDTMVKSITKTAVHEVGHTLGLSHAAQGAINPGPPPSTVISRNHLGQDKEVVIDGVQGRTDLM
ncbi:MAG: hypothetical protein ACYTGQ_17035, partial [Planctomycetota bacterium]